MINAFSKRGNLEKAVDLFTLMKEAGVKPNLVTFRTMKRAFAKDGTRENAEEFFSKMAVVHLKIFLELLFYAPSLSITLYVKETKDRKRYALYNFSQIVAAYFLRLLTHEERYWIVKIISITVSYLALSIRSVLVKRHSFRGNLQLNPGTI
jgi:pentatricopeptide repeat protein